MLTTILNDYIDQSIAIQFKDNTRVIIRNTNREANQSVEFDNWKQLLDFTVTALRSLLLSYEDNQTNPLLAVWKNNLPKNLHNIRSWLPSKDSVRPSPTQQENWEDLVSEFLGADWEPDRSENDNNVIEANGLTITTKEDQSIEITSTNNNSNGLEVSITQFLYLGVIILSSSFTQRSSEAHWSPFLRKAFKNIDFQVSLEETATKNTISEEAVKLPDFREFISTTLKEYESDIEHILNNLDKLSK